MEITKKGPRKKIFEPYYTDILKLSKKKNITLLAARKELIRNASKKSVKL